MDWLWLILLGVLIGFLSGFFGIGGGVLLVPMLVLALGFDQKEAQGTSLAVLSVPVVIVAAITYYERGQVHLPTVGWIILGFITGAYVGAKSLDFVAETVWLQRGFGLILLYVGFVFVIQDERRSRAALPAAVAAAISWLLALFVRKKLASQQPASNHEPDYHI